MYITPANPPSYLSPGKPVPPPPPPPPPDGAVHQQQQQIGGKEKQDKVSKQRSNKLLFHISAFNLLRRFFLYPFCPLLPLFLYLLFPFSLSASLASSPCLLLLIVFQYCVFAIFFFFFFFFFSMPIVFITSHTDASYAGCGPSKKRTLTTQCSDLRAQPLGQDGEVGELRGQAPRLTRFSATPPCPPGPPHLQQGGIC